MSIEDKTKTDKDATLAEQGHLGYGPHKKHVKTYQNDYMLFKLSETYMQYVPALCDIAGNLI